MSYGQPYSIEQACMIESCDSNQLHSRIKTQNNRWLAYLKNIVVLEAKINEIDDHELLRLRKLSKEELKKERFLAKNGNLEHTISNIEILTKIPKLKILRQVCEVGRYGFFELYDDSFDKPTKSIDNLFSGERLILERLKCEKKGYIRYLKNPCTISLKDIYLPPENVNRMSNQRNTSPEDKNSSMTNTHISKVMTIPVVKHSEAKPAIIKPSNSCNENSEPLRSELEKIALKSPPNHLNKSTLWKTFIKSIKDNNAQSSFEYYNSKSVKEKDSNKIWTYEMASYHLKKIVEWMEKQINT